MAEVKDTLKGYEKIKERNNIFYTNKIHNDKEFRDKEKIRVREYNKNRYKTDPEFCERLKQKSREYYQRKKLLQKPEE